MVMVVGLQIFLSRTFVGRAAQAVAQDQQALRLMAATPTKIKRIAFGLSIATASLAGACLIIIQPVEPSIGREYIGRIFAICVLGGLGSFPGMVIAAMTLGIAESLTATFFGPSWAPAASFGVLPGTLAGAASGVLARGGDDGGGGGGGRAGRAGYGMPDPAAARGVLLHRHFGTGGGGADADHQLGFRRWRPRCLCAASEGGAADRRRVRAIPLPADAGDVRDRAGHGTRHRTVLPGLRLCRHPRR